MSTSFYLINPMFNTLMVTERGDKYTLYANNHENNTTYLSMSGTAKEVATMILLLRADPDAPVAIRRGRQQGGVEILWTLGYSYRHAFDQRYNTRIASILNRKVQLISESGELTTIGELLDEAKADVETATTHVADEGIDV